jgi:RimJ/RimL family protein N-acetyltransferase
MISLETDRLILRPFRSKDLQLLVDLDTDPEVMRYIGQGETSSLESLKELLPKLLTRQEKWLEYGTWVGDLKTSGESIGWFTMKPLPQMNNEFEVGYRLKKIFWGRGFATEGTKFLLHYAFEKLNLEKVNGLTHQGNLASQHVLQKSGLKRIGNIPNPFSAEDADCVFFEIRNSRA